MAGEFWNEIGRKFSKATKKAADGTSSFIDATKIRATIGSEHKEINRLLISLGESVLKKAGRDLTGLGEEERKTAEEIFTRRGNIASLQQELAALKGMKVCPSCGELITLDAVFCAKCGAKVPVVEVPAADIPIEDAAEAVGEAADEAAEAAESVLDAEFEPVVDEVKEAAESAAEAVETFAEAAEEAVSETVGAAEEAVSEAAEAVEEAAAEAVEEAEEE